MRLDPNDMRPDRRRHRAQMFTAEVLRVVGRYVCDHRDDDHDNMKHLHRELFRLFYEQGFDAVTDLDRANAGLPLRDDKGWTEHELRALEEMRLELMRRPIFVEMPKVRVDPERADAPAKDQA